MIREVRGHILFRMMLSSRRRLMLTPIGGFVLSTLIFGGAVTADVLLSVALIVGGIFVTLRR